MSLEVVDEKSRVKIKMRSTFLNKAAALIQGKGLGADAAEAEARSTELRLYRASKDRDEYKAKAIQVFGNLKKRGAEDFQSDRPADDAPAVKKQRVEGEGGGSGAAAATAGGGGADGAAAPPAMASTGDAMRDKVRARIVAALRLVPERERTAFNAARKAQGKSALNEEEVAVSVEEGMHRTLTDTKAYKTQARNIFANIQAPDNPTFRRRVLTGEIPASAVATLGAGALASRARDRRLHTDLPSECADALPVAPQRTWPPPSRRSPTTKSRPMLCTTGRWPRPSRRRASSSAASASSGRCASPWRRRGRATSR